MNIAGYKLLTIGLTVIIIKDVHSGGVSSRCKGHSSVHGGGLDKEKLIILKKSIISYGDIEGEIIIHITTRGKGQ